MLAQAGDLLQLSKTKLSDKSHYGVYFVNTTPLWHECIMVCIPNNCCSLK